MRALALLAAAAPLLAAACSGGEAGPADTGIGFNHPAIQPAAIEQLQLSDCELAQLLEAVTENAEELALAEQESAELVAQGNGPAGRGAGAASARERDKANLHLSLAVNATTADGTQIPGGAVRPDPVATVVDGRVYFQRPELGRRYYLVVPDEVPGEYFYAALLATNELEGAVADDCLGDLFSVIWQQQYAALHPLLRQRSSAIELGYSERACLNLAAGCSNSPRVAELTLAPGVVEQRMRLGSYIGLETDYDSARDDDDAPDLAPALARNVLLHELSHILGFEHPRYAELDPDLDERSVRVPQSSPGTLPSFQFVTASPLFSPRPTPEDRRVLEKVYGGDCEYRAEPRELGEVCSEATERHCQVLGGACEVARLDAGARQERCRWHNFRDEASCERYSAGNWQSTDDGSHSTVFAGEAGACLASELPECVPQSFVASADDLAGRCCTLFGSERPGLLFEAFAAAGVRHYFCSHQKGLGAPPDILELDDATELAELSLLDAASGGSAAGWAIDAGELVQQRELPGNLALSRERMRSGCVATRVSTGAAGESGIVFNYRTASNYYVFDALPNVRRRIRQVVDGVSHELSVEPWPELGGWASGVELAVCYGDGIHTFIGGRARSRVSVEQRVDFFGSGGRIGLWNERNPGARHAYLRTESLVEGFARLRR